MKQMGWKRPLSGFIDIHMPKNTGAGIILAGLSTVLGFALIWHMWLVAGVAFVALLAVAIGHTFNYNRDYYIQAADVARVESARTEQLASHV
jgi:cytochrome o ubiquinol oxidase subunit 1